MAGLTDQEIELIARRIATDLSGRGGAAKERPAAPSAAGELGVFDSIDEAVRAAGAAFCQFDEMGLQKRDGIIAAIRNAMRENRDALAKQAHEETRAPETCSHMRLPATTASP